MVLYWIALVLLPIVIACCVRSDARNGVYYEDRDAVNGLLFFCVVLFLCLVGYGFTYYQYDGHQATVLRDRNGVAKSVIIKEPGLHFKAPWLEDVAYPPSSEAMACRSGLCRQATVVYDDKEAAKINYAASIDYRPLKHDQWLLLHDRYGGSREVDNMLQSERITLHLRDVFAHGASNPNELQDISLVDALALRVEERVNAEFELPQFMSIEIRIFDVKTTHS